MLTYYTGRARAVREALFDALKASMAEGDHPVTLVVPAQYTLEAELDAADALDLAGSFRLQVLSPQRCTSGCSKPAGAQRGCGLTSRVA
jgi:ATP-dependent helicase/DNAse subunit B